ncbi:glycoside hydrolase family 2 TIM barrel-domain containing protein [Mariniflexile sp. HNIBRBA6329]|uniref:glycoside hydrolase family 2 TIM barrel-domain containing protein n=1 Tax=Mariniflexile sp. HNIBRBA6329 TaxID=3373088 RepID=UPI003744C400
MEMPAQMISKSFEMRAFSKSLATDGETDFKGKTETFTTKERVAFLNDYANYGKLFWDDKKLNKEVYPLENAQKLLKNLKPRPVSKVRNRLLTDEWLYKGYKANKEIKEAEELNKWKSTEDIQIENSELVFVKEGELTRAVDTQNWRCRFEVDIDLFQSKSFSLSLDNCAEIGKDTSGKYYYVVNGKKVYFTPKSNASGLIPVKIDLDFTTHRYNLYIEDRLIADYTAFSDSTQNAFSTLVIKGQKGLKIDNILGIGYKKLDADAHYPFEINTFIDEDFSVSKAIGDWNSLAYDDSDWQSNKLPVVHGGERYKGEDLYLRKTINIKNIKEYKTANLYIESLTPSGIVYVNGVTVEVIHDAGPVNIDISKYLRSGNNLIAIKVDAYQVAPDQIMTHTSTDVHTGWFAGRIHLDLLKNAYIKDVFTYTDSISDTQAEQIIKVTYRNLNEDRFKGKLRISMAPWFPNEGNVVAFKEISLNAIPIDKLNITKLIIENAKLWTADDPQLYLVKTELLNEKGEVIDDYVVTTGIRTISQQGGTFQINNKPEFLKAPLLFGNRAPLEKIAQWDKCPPLEYLVQEMMMVKNMNGNGIRMSVHDSKTGGINDPRIAELADQLGLMLIWQTSAWIRQGNVFNIDFERFQADAKVVRNHPSIIIWQSANHPYSWYGWEGITTTYKKIYEPIVAIDSSRLISPSADMRIMYDIPNDEGTKDNSGNILTPDPIWTAPLITRGSMDYIGGYGAEWTTLRKWPFLEKDERPLYYETNEFQTSFLNSRDRAYFNFEQDESIGQPNWSLSKGKPWYHVPSYEWDYDIGSIGRRLEFNEWEASQAWQALIAYETLKKNRLMDYDGISWCNLRGGPNTATYQKPLIDYLGFAKLAYHSHNMGFQDIVAGSDNVDVVYGPNDMITPVIMNIGEARKVNLTVQLKTPNGKIVETKKFSNISLEQGRSINKLKPFRFSSKRTGNYVVEYIVYESK